MADESEDIPAMQFEVDADFSKFDAKIEQRLGEVTGVSLPVSGTTPTFGSETGRDPFGGGGGFDASKMTRAAEQLQTAADRLAGAAEKLGGGQSLAPYQLAAIRSQLSPETYASSFGGQAGVVQPMYGPQNQYGPHNYFGAWDRPDEERNSKLTRQNYSKIAPGWEAWLDASLIPAVRAFDQRTGDFSESEKIRTQSRVEAWGLNLEAHRQQQKEDLQLVHNFFQTLSTSPRYSGRAFRGLYLKSEDLQRMGTGYQFQENIVSSYTNKLSVAKGFAEKNTGDFNEETEEYDTPTSPQIPTILSRDVVGAARPWLAGGREQGEQFYSENELFPDNRQPLYIKRAKVVTHDWGSYLNLELSHEPSQRKQQFSKATQAYFKDPEARAREAMENATRKEEALQAARDGILGPDEYAIFGYNSAYDSLDKRGTPIMKELLDSPEHLSQIKAMFPEEPKINHDQWRDSHGSVLGKYGSEFSIVHEDMYERFKDMSERRFSFEYPDRPYKYFKSQTKIGPWHVREIGSIEGAYKAQGGSVWENTEYLGNHLQLPNYYNPEYLPLEGDLSGNRPLRQQQRQQQGQQTYGPEQYYGAWDAPASQRFKTQKELRKYLDAQYPDDQDGFRTDPLNDWFNTAGGVPADMKDMSGSYGTAFLSVLAKSPLYSGRAYRGISLPADTIRELQIGSQFKDHDLASYTTTGSSAENFAFREPLKHMPVMLRRTVENAPKPYSPDDDYDIDRHELFPDNRQSLFITSAKIKKYKNPFSDDDNNFDNRVIELELSHSRPSKSKRFPKAINAFMQEREAQQLEWNAQLTRDIPETTGGGRPPAPVDIRNQNAAISALESEARGQLRLPDYGGGRTTDWSFGGRVTGYDAAGPQQIGYEDFEETGGAGPYGKGFGTGWSSWSEMNAASGRDRVSQPRTRIQTGESGLVRTRRTQTGGSRGGSPPQLPPLGYNGGDEDEFEGTVRSGRSLPPPPPLPGDEVIDAEWEEVTRGGSRQLPPPGGSGGGPGGYPPNYPPQYPPNRRPGGGRMSWITRLIAFDFLRSGAAELDNYRKYQIAQGLSMGDPRHLAEATNNFNTQFAASMPLGLGHLGAYLNDPTGTKAIQDQLPLLAADIQDQVSQSRFQSGTLARAMTHAADVASLPEGTTRTRASIDEDARKSTEEVNVQRRADATLWYASVRADKEQIKADRAEGRKGLGGPTDDAADILGVSKKYNAYDAQTRAMIAAAGGLDTAGETLASVRRADIVRLQIARQADVTRSIGWQNQGLQDAAAGFEDLVARVPEQERATNELGRRQQLELRIAKSQAPETVDSLQKEQTQERAALRYVQSKQLTSYNTLSEGNVTASRQDANFRPFDAQITRIMAQTTSAMQAADPQFQFQIINEGAARVAAATGQHNREQQLMVDQYTYSTQVSQQLTNRQPLEARISHIENQTDLTLAQLPRDSDPRARRLINQAGHAEEVLQTQQYTDEIASETQRLSLEEKVTGLRAKAYGPGARTQRARADITQISGEAEIQAQDILRRDLGDLPNADRQRRIGVNRLEDYKANYLQNFRAQEGSVNRTALSAADATGNPTQVLQSIDAGIKTLTSKIGTLVAQD